MTARLIAVIVVIVISVGYGSPPAEDWMPFHVAARLAQSGQWSSMYPAESAGSLFDVSPGFRAAATASIQDAGVVAFRQENLTAFISPPPAAFALALLRDLPWQVSMTVWRLTLAIPVMVSILWLAAALSLRDRGAAERWSWISVLSAPLLFYVIFCGQPSAWLFVAAAISLVHATTARDIAGGTALGLAVLVKATPLVAVVLLWLAGRRRLAAIALAIGAIGSVGSIGAAGLEPWLTFGAVARNLTAIVVTDWNNASLDAAVLMLTTGADGLFHEPTRLSWTLGMLCRFVIIALAVRLALRSTEAPERRAMAAWLGWLAATPLLWVHYLIVLVPILGVAPRRHFTGSFTLVGVLAGVMALRIGGWTSNLHALLFCAVWLASALWLLSNMTKAPCQGNQ